MEAWRNSPWSSKLLSWRIPPVLILRLLSRRAGQLRVNPQCATDDPTVRAYRNLMPLPCQCSARQGLRLHGRRIPTDLTLTGPRYLAARASLPNGEPER